MKISAQVRNSQGRHQVTLKTDDHVHSIDIAPKPSGWGSSANGGELLFLALATCYCNDVYREATKSGIKVEGIEVQVEGDFGAEGTPARNVTYQARVTCSNQAAEEKIRALLQHTDQVAEIQNTLRVGTPVTLSSIDLVTP
jgi:organic hydroperoxide reductase OsmC/OhrA